MYMYAGGHSNFVNMTKFQHTPAYLMMPKFCKLNKQSILTENRHDYMKDLLGLTLILVLKLHKTHMQHGFAPSNAPVKCVDLQANLSFPCSKGCQSFLLQCILYILMFKTHFYPIKR